jgi:multidrug efflux system outer membrane protein
MKITKFIFVFILFTGFLSSCVMGPIFQKPEIKVPDNYLGADVRADSINLRWWEIFNDEVLDTMVQLALDNNIDVKMAASRIEQARAYYGMTKADLLPSIGIQAGAGRGNFGGGMKTPNVSNQFYVTPSLSWELDFWGKYRRLSESAQADLLASEWGMRSIQISLIADVSSLYFQLLDYQKRLDIAERTVELRFNSLKIIRMRFEEGIVPEIDVNQAEGQWAYAVASVPTYERAVAQTQYTLSVLLGQNPRMLLHPNLLSDQKVPEEIPAGMPSLLLERRPDITQAEMMLKSQNAQIGAAIAARFPSISLTGLLGLASSDLSTLTSGGAAWAVSGSLLGPLFNFGKNKRRVEVERKKTEEMAYNYELTVLNAFKEVEDALISITTYKKELEAREIHYKAASNAARLSKLRYDRGVTSYLEVLENERSEFEAQLVLTQTYQELLGSYVSLYKSLGGGWLTAEEEQEYQAEQENNNKQN